MIRKAWVFFALVLSVCALQGQTKEELQREKQKAFTELELARELMEQTAEKRSISVQQYRILQQGINSRARLIQTLEQEVELLDRDIADVNRQISQLEAENVKNKEEYARLIYYAYRNHTDYEKLMYILAGASISQTYQRYKYLKYLSEYRVKKAEEIERTVEELGLREQELSELKNSKLEVLVEKENEQETLVRERSQRSQMIDQLRREESRLKEEIEENERIARESEAKIRALIEEEARKLNSRNIYAALTPEQELVGKDFRKNRGKLPWPVDKGIITIGYGNHEVPGLRGSNVFNNGIDISSTPGTMVRAVFEGEVTNVFAILGANYAVLIRHGEYLSVYQNLVNVRVKTGDKVRTKEVIGEAYSDGNSKVAEVHFEVWQERDILNPEEWLSK
jgi:septal ring factor EnvC (AmiA/AmiB activator)